MSHVLPESFAQKVFSKLWTHYTSLVVDARVIEDSLRKRGDIWNEDHVAFRSLPGEHTGSHVLQQLFEMMGYTRKDPYFFEDKQLNGFWMAPPATSNRLCKDACPKIFISEIILEKFSPKFQNIVNKATSEVKASPLASFKELAGRNDEAFTEACVKFLSSGPAWTRPLWSDYETLRAESEYAAWTLIFGSCINHFTVSVQLMKTFQSIFELNEFILKDLKIPMNENGGAVKGSKELQLEQSSTLAAHIPVVFQDSVRTLPYAFVEFAYRYPEPGKQHDGFWDSYYQGFRASNADKIFESTNLR